MVVILIINGLVMDMVVINSEYEIDMGKFLTTGWKHQQANFCESIMFLIILGAINIGAQFIPKIYASLAVRLVFAPLSFGFYHVYHLRSKGEEVSFSSFFYLVDNFSYFWDCFSSSFPESIYQ